MTARPTPRRWRTVGSLAAVATAAVTPLVAALPASAATPGAGSGTQQATAKALVALRGATATYVVLLKDQQKSLPPTSLHLAQRAATLTSEQNSVVSRLAALGGSTPTNVTHYKVANALSLKITAGEAKALQTDPAVSLVVKDQRIATPAPSTATTPSAGTRQSPHFSPTPPSTTVCPSDPSKPLLEPEALTDTNDASDDPSVKTAQQITQGAGVDVAYIADSIDPNAPDFIRPDGSHAIIDYQAFNADGPALENDGEEAFGDASSIAAQGTVSHDLSTYVNSNYPLPTGCNIRIVGMAPRANIVALKIDFYDTSIIQAIDYAVSHDHVSVLNESFGANVYPDNATRSVVAAFDDEAVAAGTTVTVSAGDAGTTSTIGSPATDPNVITVGANTNSRSYLQTGYAGARTFGNGKWVNDEISSLSSGGITNGGTTVDLVAPGESGWAVCSKATAECNGYNGKPADVIPFGGTSQSAPLTAGAAALVIAAYRSTHNGASPTPAQVKTILVGTTHDLGFPAFEQGAGLLDARAAVEAALNYPGTTAATPTGTFIASPGQIDVDGTPGQTKQVSVSLQNLSTSATTVTQGSRDFTTASTENLSTTLSTSSAQTFPYPTNGAPWVYQKVTFTVPAGTDRLVTAMRWNGQAKKVGSSTVTPVVRISLFEPDGTYAANSRPQGGAVSANYANLDVRAPVAGTWTAVLYTQASASGYNGTVSTQMTYQRAVNSAEVSPTTGSVTVPGGGSTTLNYTVTVPATSGDTSTSITLANGTEQTSIPVVIRSVIATPGGAGALAGDITGGNARAGAPAQTFTYAVDVPAGHKDLTVGVSLTTQGDVLEGLLVDPNDETQAIDTNAYQNAAYQAVTPGKTVEMATANPIPGRWRIVIVVINPVTGNDYDQPFTGTVAFDRAKVSATGLPNSTGTSLAKGVPTTATVTVTNTTVAPINVQVDPRGAKGLQSLPSPFGAQQFTLPSHAGDPTFIVPPGTDDLQAVTFTTAPVINELLSGTQSLTFAGKSQAGSYKPYSYASIAEDDDKGDVSGIQAGTTSTGVWFTDADEIGTVGTAGAPSADAETDLVARTPAYANDITSSTGDFFAASFDPNADIGTPLTLQPGQTGTVTVTITPSGATGSTESGTLYVTTPPNLTQASFNTTGDVLAALPYSFTVAGGPAAALPEAPAAVALPLAAVLVGAGAYGLRRRRRSNAAA